jgi:hypothetical protein
MFTTAQFLKLDNCQQRIKLPLWHINVKNDRYFNKERVAEHLRVIYEQVHVTNSVMDSHAPSIIADKKIAAPLIPDAIRKMLAKSSKSSSPKRRKSGYTTA